MVNCRRVLIDNGILRKPVEDVSSFLRSTLRRLNKAKVGKLRAVTTTSGGEHYKGIKINKSKVP